MVFNVTKLLLNLLHSTLVSGVLPHIITQLNGGATGSGSDLDDDVERLGFRAIGLVCEVVWVIINTVH